ncbi:hypothetical protein ACEPAF_4559 [Sanghuangporus sanghuang]
MSSDLYAVADFCLIPMGTEEPSVAIYIAECQRVLQKTGLTYKVRVSLSLSCPTLTESRINVRQMHGYGTNLEGPWSEVMKAIHDCHAAVHAQGAPRIATDIRIGTRTDRDIAPGTGNEGKVARVEQLLNGRDPK